MDMELDQSRMEWCVVMWLGMFPHPQVICNAITSIYAGIVGSDTSPEAAAEAMWDALECVGAVGDHKETRYERSEAMLYTQLVMSRGIQDIRTVGCLVLEVLVMAMAKAVGQWIKECNRVSYHLIRIFNSLDSRRRGVVPFEGLASELAKPGMVGVDASSLAKSLEDLIVDLNGVSVVQYGENLQLILDRILELQFEASLASAGSEISKNLRVKHELCRSIASLTLLPSAIAKQIAAKGQCDHVDDFQSMMRIAQEKMKFKLRDHEVIQMHNALRGVLQPPSPESPLVVAHLVTVIMYKVALKRLTTVISQNGCAIPPPPRNAHPSMTVDQMWRDVDLPLTTNVIFLGNPYDSTICHRIMNLYSNPRMFLLAPEGCVQGLDLFSEIVPFQYSDRQFITNQIEFLYHSEVDSLLRLAPSRPGHRLQWQCAGWNELFENVIAHSPKFAPVVVVANPGKKLNRAASIRKHAGGNSRFSLFNLGAKGRGISQRISSGSQLSFSHASEPDTIQLFDMIQAGNKDKLIAQLTNPPLDNPPSLDYRLSAINKKKQSLMHVTARYGHDKIAKELLALGLTEWAPLDEKKRTPLHIAAKRGNTKVLAQLLNYEDADDDGKPVKAIALKWIDKQDIQGHTALHLATRFNHHLSVRELLTAGARTHVKDKQGKTALDIATANQLKQVLEEMTSSAASASASRKESKSPRSVKSPKKERSPRKDGKSPRKASPRVAVAADTGKVRERDRNGLTSPKASLSAPEASPKTASRKSSKNSRAE
eukprot:c13079_g5_i5.p1 GENE.c13079_g5_i5~~c13079_g5_i5.p1  ORF type:complete len:768 (-),score=206.14 c13079_g5_i5:100-2403(-)